MGSGRRALLVISALLLLMAVQVSANPLALTSNPNTYTVSIFGPIWHSLTTFTTHLTRITVLQNTTAIPTSISKNTSIGNDDAHDQSSSKSNNTTSELINSNKALKTQVADLIYQISSLNNTINQDNATIAVLQKENSNNLNKLNIYSKVLDTLQAEVNNLEVQLNSTNNQISSLQSQVSSLKSHVILSNFNITTTGNVAFAVGSSNRIVTPTGWNIIGPFGTGTTQPAGYYANQTTAAANAFIAQLYAQAVK